MPITERTAPNTSAPHSERKPLVTLRKIVLGRSARSEALFVKGTSRSVTNTSRLSRILP